ncbi:MAG TPA: hypothetical protein VE871_13035 [Longimicrobium sp.]|nr:hypothetical protein [Longimicrobium sp.]
MIRLGNYPALTDAQITSMSYRWMQLNILRNVVLQALMVYGMVGLMRLAQARVIVAAPVAGSPAPARLPVVEHVRA